jgi:flagellin
MRELAVQSASDTNTDDDRTQIQNEIDQLTQEVDRIANTTEFNTKKLLNGDQKGAVTEKEGTYNIEGTFSNSLVEIGDISSTDIMKLAKDSNVIRIEILTDGGGDIKEGVGQLDEDGNPVELEEGESPAKPNYRVTLLHKTISTELEEVASEEEEEETTSSTPFDVTIAKGVNLNSEEEEEEEEGATLQGSDNQVIKLSGFFGIKEKVSTGEEEEEEEENESGIATKTGTGAINLNKTSDDIQINIKNASKLKAGDVITITLGEAVQTTPAATGKDALRLQIGANAGQEVALGINSMRTQDLDIADKETGKALNVSDQNGASLAVNAYDLAIQKVSTERAKMGAMQNRLEHTVANLDSAAENTQNSESRIRDTDMAAQMVEFSKSNILAQAGQSMLAQANQSTQGVLSLLG